jgi:hypothetical protein
MSEKVFPDKEGAYVPPPPSSPPPMAPPPAYVPMQPATNRVYVQQPQPQVRESKSIKHILKLHEIYKRLYILKVHVHPLERLYTWMTRIEGGDNKKTTRMPLLKLALRVRSLICYLLL